jgi:isopropylmalate/homocitrate/citramalate synthase
MLRNMNIETGTDLDRLISVSQYLERKMGKELPGQVARAGAFPEITLLQNQGESKP